MKHIQLFEQYQYELYEKKYSSSERKKLEKKGHAMPGGRFPIVDLADLRNSIWYLGKQGIKGVEEVAKFIAKRMKELDALKYKDTFDKALTRAGAGSASDYL